MNCLIDFSGPNSTESYLSNSMQTILQSIEAAQSNNNDYCEHTFISGKRYYNCTFPGCGKSFPFESEFLRHKYIHSSERPVQCPFPNCTKAFKREDTLKNHLRIHTGETPYKCQEPGCGKGFCSKAGLRYHRLKHKGEKEYICRVAGCNRRFLSMSQLKQHEKTLVYHKNTLGQGPLNESQENLADYIRKRKCQNMYQKEDVESKTNFVKEPKWKVSTQDYNNEKKGKLSEGFEQEFKRIVEFLVNENNIIKMRLDMCNTVKELENKLAGANYLFEKERESRVPDYFDQDMLDFLKFND